MVMRTPENERDALIAELKAEAKGLDMRELIVALKAEREASVDPVYADNLEKLLSVLEEMQDLAFGIKLAHEGNQKAGAHLHTHEKTYVYAYAVRSLAPAIFAAAEVYLRHSMVVVTLAKD